MRSVKPRGFGGIPSATGGVARLACAQLRKLGKDVRLVVSGAGLTVQEADDPTTRLEVHAQVKVLELAAEELRDELLGFHLARNFDLREIGLLYYVMASSQRLADALRNCERYSRINNEGVRLNFSVDRTATITLDYISADRWSDRHHLEFWLVTLVRICRQLTANQLAPHKLRVRHFRADPPAEFKAFFGADVEFGADADEIVFFCVSRFASDCGTRHLSEQVAATIRGRSACFPTERAREYPFECGANRAAATAARQSQRVGSRAPAWDESSNAIAEAS
ncbi:AraC family transcriptional regulator [Bradyrhizobium sp. NAS80.1]|uniref:AraC family transcriptional regulator n=1 Tax=Bradyrhizobium sp. NAS80.1 TaxID=1680159 RepID=UPI001FD9F3BB|nr:AraC family transcriptional regulator [Bradyrhizobium sp. NAS80.1]